MSIGDIIDLRSIFAGGLKMKDNVFNINIYETVANSSEYIPIIIGGLFGLTTLMLAVFSLISNDVTKKTSGFSLINLKDIKDGFYFCQYIWFS